MKYIVSPNEDFIELVSDGEAMLRLLQGYKRMTSEQSKFVARKQRADWSDAEGTWGWNL